MPSSHSLNALSGASLFALLAISFSIRRPSSSVCFLSVNPARRRTTSAWVRNSKYHNSYLTVVPLDVLRVGLKTLIGHLGFVTSLFLLQNGQVKLTARQFRFLAALGDFSQHPLRHKQKSPPRCCRMIDFEEITSFSAR